MFSKNILKPSIVQGITPMILLVCLGTKVADANKKVYLYRKLGKSLGKDPTQDGANKPGLYDTRAFGEKVLRANGYCTFIKSKMFGDMMLYRPCQRIVSFTLRKQLDGTSKKIARKCGRFCDSENVEDAIGNNICSGCAKILAQQPTHIRDINAYEQVHGTGSDVANRHLAYEAYCRMIRDEIQGEWKKGQKVIINTKHDILNQIDFNIKGELTGKITKVNKRRGQIIVKCTDESNRSCELSFAIGDPCVTLPNVRNANILPYSDFKKCIEIYHLIKIGKNPSCKKNIDIYLGSDITKNAEWDPKTQQDAKNVLRSILGQKEGDDNSEYYLQHTKIKDFDSSMHVDEDWEQSVCYKVTPELPTITEEEESTPGAKKKPTPKKGCTARHARRNSRVADARKDIDRTHNMVQDDINASFQSMKNLIKRAAVQHSRESDPVRADMLLGYNEVKFGRRRRMMRSLSRLVQSEMKMSA